jgi:putative ABC transport system permease protein
MTRLAWRNVLRNWRHSLATIMAIASGFMAVSLFDGFLRELEYRNYDGFSARGMLGQVLVQRKDAQKYSYDDQWQYALGTKEQAWLEEFFHHDPGFRQRVRFLSVAGMVNAGPHSAVFIGLGYDLKEGAEVRGDRWYWNVLAGEPLDRAKEPSIQLGMGLGHLLDCESTYTGPSIFLEDGNYRPEPRPFTCKYPRVTLSATTESAQVNALDVPVAALYDAGFREGDKRAASMDLRLAQRLLDTYKVTTIAVQLKDGADPKDFVNRLQAAATAAGLSLDVMPWEEHSIAAYVKGGIQILHVFRNLFMAIVVTIGVMSVANTMMKSVNERVREIGTLRSLGFLRRHLVFMFSLEGMFLSFLACAIGLALTLIASAAIAHMGFSYRAGILSVPILLRVKYVPAAWAVSAVILSLLATGTSWFCSRRASRMVIADAMRHV